MNEETIVRIHGDVDRAAALLEATKDRRAMVFALANQNGMTSGDLARLTHCQPMQALHAIRTGRRLLLARQQRKMGSAA